HGYQVRGTVRNPDKVPALRAMFAKYTDKADSIEFAQADLLSEDGWTEAAQGCDGLFHLASPVPLQQPKNHEEVIRPAVDGALNALKAANNSGIKRVVLTSSIAAVMFGHKEKHRTFSEADWTNVEATDVAYYKSKALAEKAAWDYVKDTDIQLSTVLPAFVLGPALESDYGTSLQLIVE
ncbi:NAD-dependent epimerase/dehydratase family protein, partial [Oleiphilus sp. HI0125]